MFPMLATQRRLYEQTLYCKNWSLFDRSLPKLQIICFLFPSHITCCMQYLDNKKIIKEPGRVSFLLSWILRGNVIQCRSLIKPISPNYRLIYYFSIVKPNMEPLFFPFKPLLTLFFLLSFFFLTLTAYCSKRNKLTILKTYPREIVNYADCSALLEQGLSYQKGERVG